MIFNDKDLVRRALMNARPNQCGRVVPLWAAVEDHFGLGSTAAHELCVLFGFNPEEKRFGATCERCAEFEEKS